MTTNKIVKICLFYSIIILVCSVHLATAHYGMVIPSDEMVMPQENKTITLTLSFSHPFERRGMDLAKPKVFAVVSGHKQTDLLDGLQETRVMAHRGWETQYKIRRPGAYIFIMEPAPYWEPAEDCFIIHLTKTVVAAFGDAQGWDAEVGLKTEIIPLTQPFGLYTGNLFQGIVKYDGQPAPYSMVEVEYFNADGKSQASSDYMITQSVKADGNGVFAYSVPKSGWWGFAALNRADFKLKHNGQDKEAELGAVLWIRFHDWKSAADKE